MFSKIIENFNKDQIPLSLSNNDYEDHFIEKESTKKRPKTTLHRKNELNSDFLINETNKKFENLNVLNPKESEAFRNKNPKNQKNIEIGKVENNPPNITKKHNILYFSENFGANDKQNDKVNLEKFKLSNDDFHYSREFDDIKNFNNNNYNNKINEKKKIDSIDKQKLIEEYRKQLNKKLINRLNEEKEKEEIREKTFNNTKDSKKRKKLEERYNYERALATAEIVKIEE